MAEDRDLISASLVYSISAMEFSARLRWDLAFLTSSAIIFFSCVAVSFIYSSFPRVVEDGDIYW